MSPSQAAAPLVSIRNLKVAAPGGRLLLDDVTLTVRAGETVGLVGESGAGKSMTALAIIGLLHGVRVVSGQISYRGKPLPAMSPEERRRLRGREIGLIEQEPSRALDPLVTIGGQLEELFRYHDRAEPRQARQRALEALQRAGIGDPARIAASFAHQLSGGQRQRALIALADALEPRLLIADEPTSALDVRLQAEILALLADLSVGERSLLLISHELAHVTAVADRVVVLWRGRVVEEGPCAELLQAPREEYTRQLLAASGVSTC